MIQLLESSEDVGAAMAILLREYDVQEEQLQADLLGLIQKLAEHEPMHVEA